MDLKEQFYGTEIEMTGITRKHAAEVVSEMFGTSIYHRHSYTSCPGNKRNSSYTAPARSAGKKGLPPGRAELHLDIQCRRDGREDRAV